MRLASPGSYRGGSNANFGPGGVNNGNVYCGYGNTFNSNGNWNAGRFAVRPVASVYYKKCINDKIGYG